MKSISTISRDPTCNFTRSVVWMYCSYLSRTVVCRAELAVRHGFVRRKRAASSELPFRQFRTWRTTNGAFHSTRIPENRTCRGNACRIRSIPLIARRGSATDMVTLGRSGVKVTRLAFGTGTLSGQVQRELGQDGFTRLVRHAYDRGIRFFETAESYGEMHRMLGVALKGIPRDSYQLMSKVTTREGVDPQQKFDELRRLANTDYFDIMLLHWQHTATGRPTRRAGRTQSSRSQSQKVVLSHGASVHGLPALRQVPGNKWLQVAMIRVNHTGKSMDAEDYATQGPGNVPEVVTHVQGGPQGRHGRDFHEACGRRHFRSRGPSEGDEVCVPERGRRLRHGGLQEPCRNRRSDREPEFALA